jgi:putative flippase GtrA
VKFISIAQDKDGLARGTTAITDSGRRGRTVRKDVMDMTGVTVSAVPGIGIPGPCGVRLHPTLVQLSRYALIGGAGTVVNVVLFLVARNWLPAVPANLVAIVLSTLATTEANRRFTFQAERHRLRILLQNVGTVLFYAFYGAAVLMLLGAAVARPTPLMESAAVASASVLGGLARFAVMRLWAFAPGHGPRRHRLGVAAASAPSPQLPLWEAAVVGRLGRASRVELPVERAAPRGVAPSA